MKRLILCCDGTWGRADQEFRGRPSPTNVVELGFRIAKHDGRHPQILWYDEGVGTGNLVDRVVGAVSGAGLDANLFEGYRFLVGNYQPGDEIFLFGFSRGAFTARSIAGMIRKCGILRRDRMQDYAKAVQLYRSADHPDDKTPSRFRAAASVCGSERIPIRFIGVWDTVGALGIPLRRWEWLTRARYQFHDTELSGSVSFGYHALSIDERREPFTPTLWAYKPKRGQTVEQVWFCGTHSDVGGGFAGRGLSDIALQWMMDKAQGAGLAFDPLVQKARPLGGDALAPISTLESLLHRFLLGRDRVIGSIPGEAPGRLDPTQSVHTSVLRRWVRDSRYRPAGLRDYFALSGVVPARRGGGGLLPQPGGAG